MGEGGRHNKRTYRVVSLIAFLGFLLARRLTIQHLRAKVIDCSGGA